ncbi:MAG: hypothetical protein IPH84_01510 [Bacteroidales bacterium]|nr:hypothetical protein [Bacteroidales bacterium]
MELALFKIPLPKIFDISVVLPGFIPRSTMVLMQDEIAAKNKKAPVEALSS